MSLAFHFKGATLEEQKSVLRQSGLFDENYYFSQLQKLYPDTPEDVDLLEHYLKSDLGLDPHPLFSSAYYLTQNKFPEAVKAPALLHYLGTTGKEAYRPHVLFDTHYYLLSNPDLLALSHKINPLKHFRQLGGFEGRSPHPLFDSAYYLEQIAPEERGQINPLLHYLTTGYKHGLNPHEFFDGTFYLAQIKQEERPGLEPLGHYLLSAEKAKVSPHPLFKPAYYLSQLPEKARQCENLLLHFLEEPQAHFLSPHPAFDAEYYARLYPDLKKQKVHLFLHYFRHGYLEGRNPNAYFQSAWYLRRKPQLRASKRNALLDYVSLPEGQSPQAHPFLDREGKFNCLLGSEAAVAQGWESCPWDYAFDELMHFARAPFTHLFIIPGLVRAGGERAASSFIKMFQEKYGTDNVLVLMADYFEHSSRHWLPESTRLFDLRRRLPKDYAASDMALLLATFIARCAPQVTHFVNSFSGLSCLCSYGEFLGLKGKSLVYIFGYESYAENNFQLLKNPIFNAAFAVADCLITDTQRLALAVKQQVPARFSEGKITRECYLYSEHMEEIRLKQRLGRRTQAAAGKVLWASRITHSKRPDLLAKIASLMPDIEFVVYGSAELETEENKRKYLELLGAVKNITLAGDFSDFADLELGPYSAFLYTSQGDGIPLVLLEAACAGLPLVAPRVGGIGELLSRENSWLIERFDDTEAYVTALREAFSNEELVQLKVAKLSEGMEKQHSKKYFAQQLEDLAAYF